MEVQNDFHIAQTIHHVGCESVKNNDKTLIVVDGNYLIVMISYILEVYWKELLNNKMCWLYHNCFPKTNTVLFNVLFYESIFSDIQGYVDGKIDLGNGYTIFAGNYRIALGIPEVIAIVSNEKYYDNNFKPDSTAKVKDCVAFIMRCIKERENADYLHLFWL